MNLPKQRTWRVDDERKKEQFRDINEAPRMHEKENDISPYWKNPSAVSLLTTEQYRVTAERN